MAENENNNQDKNKGRMPQGRKPSSQMWLIIASLLALVVFVIFGNSSNAVEINQNEFEKMLVSHDVLDIVIVNDRNVEVTLKPEALENEKYKTMLEKKPSFPFAKTTPHFQFTIISGESFKKDLDGIQEDFAKEDKVGYRVETRKGFDSFFFSYGFLILMLVGFWFLMRRMTGSMGGGSQIFNIGKSKAQLFDKEKNVSVTFKDVAGLEGAKQEVEEIVDFLKNPKKYTDLGAKIPKGALLVGPPGTGKTLLAKAVAGEAQVPFFSLSGSDFVEMFVGVGASRVRDLFKQAKSKAPSIIFIDEIDAIGRARGKSMAQGGNDERENTLNQLLTEMDGFGSNSGVIILAATNRADILDRALLRAGRFDRQIHVDLPDVVERKEIFEVHLKPLKVDKSIDPEFLAKQTPGFSGADIANICNEAALIAARKQKITVNKQDFLDAVDRIIGGLEKKHKLITKHEKEVIAYHEAGHASVSWLLEHAAPLVKVTIVPRGRSLGAAWYLPEERQITTKEQMMDEMCAALGGRAAEQVIFGKISTGALSDLEKITKQAYAMVTMYGLNDKIGNISFYDSTGQSEYSFSKPYSEHTAQMIDEEVSKMVEDAYDRTVELLNRNKDKLTLLARELMKHEVIFKEDLEKIFGPRPFPSREDLLIKKGDDSSDKLSAASKDTTADTANTENNVSDSGKDENNAQSNSFSSEVNRNVLVEDEPGTGMEENDNKINVSEDPSATPPVDKKEEDETKPEG